MLRERYLIQAVRENDALGEDAFVSLDCSFLYYQESEDQ